MARRAPRPLLSARAWGWLALATLLVAASPPVPLELETLEGEPVALAPRPGRPLVVHFWATWCPSCAEELPALAQASVACSGSVEIAIVDVDEEAEEIRRFLTERELSLTSLRDPGGRAWRASVGARGLPANLVWTQDGERRSELGPRTRERWQALFAELGCDSRLPEP
ncbi:MAG: TlpA family protein disulfide reductase [Myxococcales bacterium]|nr:MAG: TlpA family protein disulfide reductase [Myxococcales bacterium]